MLEKHLAKEDPETDSAEVARVWAKAYGQLVDFEELTLKRVIELLPSLSAEARHEAEITNLPMIAQHLQTFRYRRAQWRKRVEDLNGK